MTTRVLESYRPILAAHPQVVWSRLAHLSANAALIDPTKTPGSTREKKSASVAAQATKKIAAPEPEEKADPVEKVIPNESIEHGSYHPEIPQ